MFPCFGRDKYWPLTGNVGLLRAPLRKVAQRVVNLSRGSSWSLREFDTLDDAIAGLTPFRFCADQARFAVSTAGSEWVVVLDMGFPGGDVAGFMGARARLDLHCEFVAVEWMPKSSKALPGATFVHYLPTRSRLNIFSGPSRSDERRYLAAVGIPMDKEGWLSGPVLAATREPFGGDNQEWSSMVELRRLCGYPEDRIPTDLVRF